MDSLAIMAGVVVAWSAIILGPYWAVTTWHQHQADNKGGDR